MENLIKDYFKDKELTIENVIKMCENHDKLRFKISDDLEKYHHREDIVCELIDMDLTATDEEIEQILIRFEDTLEDSDHWWYILRDSIRYVLED